MRISSSTRQISNQSLGSCAQRSISCSAIPLITPSPDELAMALAARASLRSADMTSSQVAADWTNEAENEFGASIVS
jgi:hypothetical protein